MSLVGDALRKARREAVQRRSPGLGLGVPSTVAGAPRGTRFGVGLVLGATIALAAAIGGAATMWWLLAAHHSADSGAPAPVAGTVGIVPATPGPLGAWPSPTPAPRQPGALPAALAGGVTAPVAELPRVAPQEPTPVVASAMEGATGLEPAGGQTPAAGGAPQGNPAPGEERVFVVDADLGYAHLSLGYVVFRATDPFAEINGREVHVGAVVDGFTVEGITGEAVRLRDSRGPLVLRVK